MKRNAFTLIELSIVLVIIGLIVGGVLVGQDLIQAAKERGILSEMTKYETAVNTYRLKYNALPGDHDDAFAFFGTDCAANATLCNGNGNKFIGETVGVLNQEAYRTPQHLSLAGLVEGSYTGVTATPAVPGQTVMPTDYAADMGYFPVVLEFDDFFAVGSAHASYSGPLTNFLKLGKINGNNSPYLQFLTGPEARRIDQKIDDGLPGKGKIIANRASYGCSDGTNPDTANYGTNQSYIHCLLALKY